MTLIELFNLGMMRKYPEPLSNKEGVVLNLGAGNKSIPNTIEHDWPSWDANCDSLPYDENSVDMIHCYHLLEHLSNPVHCLGEIAYVLKPLSHVNIVVPYYNSSLQAQDLDHKCSFTEHTFRTLFDRVYYDKNKLKPMKIHTNFIMADEEKNLCLIVQLQKIAVDQ